MGLMPAPRSVVQSILSHVSGSISLVYTRMHVVLISGLPIMQQ